MKRLFLLTIVFLLHFGFNAAYAQGSNTGLGLRFSPDGIGFSGKFFLKSNSALEVQLNAGGIWGLEGESFNAVGLYEYHIPLDHSWRVYLGVGGHIGSWEHSWRDDGRWKYGKEPIFGVDGIAGIEYVFHSAPIGISFDVKPAVNFISDVDYFPHNMLGFGLRFYL